MQNIAKGLTKRFAYTFSYKKTLINSVGSNFNFSNKEIRIDAS